MSRLGGSYKVVSKTSVEAIPVAGEVVVYTRAFDLRKMAHLGTWVLGNAATNPNIEVELELAPTQPTEAQEGFAATTLFAIKSGDVIFDAITDKVAHITTPSPVPMAWGRYKLTGLPGNPEDATLTIKNFQQDEV